MIASPGRASPRLSLHVFTWAWASPPVSLRRSAQSYCTLVRARQRRAPGELVEPSGTAGSTSSIPSMACARQSLASRSAWKSASYCCFPRARSAGDRLHLVDVLLEPFERLRRRVPRRGLQAERRRAAAPLPQHLTCVPLATLSARHADMGPAAVAKCHVAASPSASPSHVMPCSRAHRRGTPCRIEQAAPPRRRSWWVSGRGRTDGRPVAPPERMRRVAAFTPI